MPILRVVTDIKVGGSPTWEELEKVNTLTLQFAHGVVADACLQPDDKGSKSESHFHVSTEDEACEFCKEHARDLLPRT